MENIVIRKIRSDEVEAADYGPEGVDTFKRDIVENAEFIENARKGLCPIYAAFDGKKMVSIMGMRNSKTHINLVFTRKEYHRKGIARAIFNYLLNDLLSAPPICRKSP